MNWIRQVLQPGTLAEDDRTVLAEYFALLEYKLLRRDELDRRIETLALTPRYKPVVDRIACFRGFKTHAAMVLGSWPSISASRPWSRPGDTDDTLGPSTSSCTVDATKSSASGSAVAGSA